MNKKQSSFQEEVYALNRKAWSVMLSDPQEGLGLCTRAREISEQRQFAEGIADSCLHQGWCYTYLGQPDSALTVLEHSLDLYTELENLVGCMKCLNAIGVIYHKISQYESALEFYSRSLALSQAAKNEEQELTALNNLGEFYQELGNHKDALENFRTAREIAERTGDKECLPPVLVNTALVNRSLGYRENALLCIEEALSLLNDFEDNITRARCYTVMGLIYFELDKDVLAESYHEKSIALSRATGDRNGEVEAMFNLGELYEKTGKKEEAVVQYRSALKCAEEIQARIFEERCHKRISRIEEAAGHYTEALKHFQLFYQVEKQIFNEQAEERLKNLVSQHEIERSQKEAEIYKLRTIEMKKKSSLLESAYKRIKIISEIGQKITASLDIEQIAHTIYEHVITLMDADSFGIALYHPKTESIEYRVLIEGQSRIPSFTAPINPEISYASWCIAHGTPVFINDNEAEYTGFLKQRPETRGEPSSSLIYLPLIIEERIIGVITVQSFKKDSFTVHHLDLLQALGSYIAIALENSIIHEEVNSLNSLLVKEKGELESANRKIAHMANHDNLTGLPNRRLLYELLKQTMPHAVRHEKKLALFYIDLDNFKPVNDELGHGHGDEVLMIVAERLKASLRKSDTVARIGGDEFVTIIADVQSREHLETVAEKTVRSLDPPLTVRGEKCRIGMSIGISLFPDDAENFEDLLKKADEALYALKNSGKNGYCFYQEGEGNRCIHLD